MKFYRLASALLAALLIAAAIPPPVGALGTAPLLETLIEPSLKTESLYEFTGGSAITYSEGRGCELIGTDGKTLTERPYDLIRPCSSGLYVAALNGKYGALSLRGKLMVALSYDSLSDFLDGCAVSVKNGVTQIINLAGGVSPPLDYAKTELLPGGLFRFEQDGLWGLAAVSGEILAEPVYDKIGNFSEDRAVVRKNGLSGAISSSGAEVIRPAYASLSGFKGGMSVVWTEGLCAIADKDGKMLTPFKYSAARLENGVAVTETSSGDSSIVSVSGEELPLEYSVKEVFSDGLWIVSDGALYGVMNTRGELVLPLEYDGIAPGPDGIGIAFKDGELIFIDEFSDSKIVRFDESGDPYPPISYERADFTLVRSTSAPGGLWGISDFLGNALLPAQYSKIIPAVPLFEGYSEDAAMDRVMTAVASGHVKLTGLFWTLKDGKWGLIRLTSREDIPTGWARAHVERAIALEIVSEGFARAYSSPATRAEFCGLAVALYEHIKGSEIPLRVKFTDTDDINVEKMAGLNVVAGTGGSRFSPDDPITREQAALILSKLIDALGSGRRATSGADSYTDTDAISEWARPYVLRVRALGIMSGVGDGKFGPKGQYTREQCITTLLKVHDLVKK